MTALRIDQPLADDHDALPRTRADVRPIPRITIQAFCDTHETTAAFEAAGQDRRMARAHLKVQTGGIEAAVEYYREAATPNLVLVETTERREKILEQLGRFAEVCDPSTKVVIIGHVNDILLYRELMKQGVSDYVVAPLDAVDVVELVSRLYSDPGAKPVGRSIAFVGAKGGVGASTIAHNVAAILARSFGLDTLIADLDLAFGTANLDFNVDPSQGTADAVFSPERLDHTFLDRLLAGCGDHLSLLAAPSTLDRTYDLADGAFEPLVDLVRSAAPYVVFDVPHVWAGWTKRTLVSSDDIVIVASPDLANLRNTKNLADLLKSARPNDPAPKLVINQVGMPKRPEIKPADFAKAVDLPAAAVIPFDAALFGAAANAGQMLHDVQKSARSVDALRALAENLSGRTVARRAAGMGPARDLINKLRALVPAPSKS